MPKFNLSKDGKYRCTLRAEVKLTREEYEELKKLARMENETIRDILFRVVDNGLSYEWERLWSLLADEEAAHERGG